MSKIEQIIEEIEEYIDNCKYQPLSNTKIVVNKDEILELLSELRLRTPDEIKKYQKIISNKDAILENAREQADSLIQQAAVHTNELINEHEIMQQAYVKANEIVQSASEQAQAILDHATEDANNIRLGAMQYTNEMLMNVQNIIANTTENVRVRYEGFNQSMSKTYELLEANRMQLFPEEEEESLEEDLHNPGEGQYFDEDL